MAVDTIKNFSQQTSANKIELELMTLDNDFLMSCADRICEECGNDHTQLYFQKRGLNPL